MNMQIHCLRVAFMPIISHFRVAVCLWLKASLSASNDIEFDLHEKHNSFPYKWFCSCFETEASNNSEMGY